MITLLFVSSAVADRVSEGTVDGCRVYVTQDELTACFHDAINTLSAIPTVLKDDIRPTVQDQHGSSGEGEE